MSLSRRLLDENAGDLERMLSHRFVRDIAGGTLPAAVFDRYLAYEGAFVETAIGIFAFATARAPDLAARRWLIGVQRALAGEQMEYFEAVRAARGLPPPGPLPPAAAAFDDGMREIAEGGGFLDIAAAMFAAEWMYWTWCSRADPSVIADPDMRRWVALHATPAFRAQADWLGAALDRHARPADAARLSGIVGHVTRLEIAFHDAPYAEPAEPAHV